MNNESTICGGGYKSGMADESLTGVEHFGGHRGGRGGSRHGGGGYRGGYRRYGGYGGYNVGWSYPWYYPYDYGYYGAPSYNVNLVPFVSNQTLFIMFVLLIALLLFR